MNTDYEEYGPYSIPAELEGIIVSTPDTLSGGLRFEGTRIFVSALLDGIAAGDSLDEILDAFPGIGRNRALTVLAWQGKLVRETIGIKSVG